MQQINTTQILDEFLQLPPRWVILGRLDSLIPGSDYADTIYLASLELAQTILTYQK